MNNLCQSRNAKGHRCEKPLKHQGPHINWTQLLAWVDGSQRVEPVRPPANTGGAR